MEIEELTTEPVESHVNNDEQVIEEEVVPVEVEETNQEPDTTEYDKAWDSVDLNDDSIFNKEPEEVKDENPLNSEDTHEKNTYAFMVDKPVLNYKGKDIPIDSGEELIALAQKGFSYETEMANLKPKKRILKIIDSVPEDVLQAISDINGGNKNAIEYIQSKYGIESSKQDSYNMFNEEPEEKPTEYVPETVQDNPLDDFWDDYSRQSQTNAAKVSDIYSSLDEGFKAEVYKPDVFQAFVASVESGEFENVYPVTIKEKTLNPAMTWIQAYGSALSKAGTEQDTQTEPPVTAVQPSARNQNRNLSTSDADRVWNDDQYFKDIENKIFG